MVLTVAAGMKLENHPIISFTFSTLISAIAAICSNGNFARCITVTNIRLSVSSADICPCG